MSSASMNFKILHALEVMQRVEKANDRYIKVISVLGWFADGLLAHRIDSLSCKMVNLVESMKLTAITVELGDKDSYALDPDLRLSEKLSDLKNEVHEVRATSIQSLGISARMPKTSVRLKEFSNICAELYEAANQLQWQIAEHDAQHSQRYDGFVASSAAELDVLLDKISGV